MTRFTKLSGAGNDFILVAAPGRGPALARKWCPRGSAIGADGILVVSKNPRPRVRYYNADGSPAFCGNGMRCAAWWMHDAGWTGSSFTMDTPGGVLKARILGANRASVQMPDIRLLAKNRVDTGVPHAVVRVASASLDRLDPISLGRPLRKKFNANVDFVAIGKDGSVRLRTYERGVENETLACGTGVVAAAWFASGWTKRPAPISVRARGGLLRVRFQPDGTGVFLEGPVHKIYDGETRL